MAWSNADIDFTQKQNRYVPPQHRSNTISGFNNANSYAFCNESAQSGFSPFARFGTGRHGWAGPSSGHFSTAGRGRGRHRGRGGRFGCQERVIGSSPCPNRDAVDELEVIEEDSNFGGINFDAYEDIPVEASGSDISPPVNTFAELDLDEGLNKNIRRCKYVKPTPIQRHAMPNAVAGRDLMACAQTGSGKTAAFCFPIISGILKSRLSLPSAACGGGIVYPSALILSPTRELSCQIHDETKKFAYQTGVKVAVAYGGAPIVNQLRSLERGVDILVATPGRLVDIIKRERVSLRRIKYLALDEADRMLDMGFEPQIRKIVEQMDMPPPGVRQTLLFSATFPNDIQKLASDFLSNYIFLAAGRVGSSSELIMQKVELVQDIDKRNHLLDLLHSQRANGAHGKQALTLVFVATKKGADALQFWLSNKGFPAIAIHGDKVQLERERALKSFKTGATPVLVATDVASRGLDIPHVSHVINFDLPKDIDDYVHRIGRTGRAGKSGLATAFFSDYNTPLAKALVGLLQEANQEVPSWLSQYAETLPSVGGSRRSQRYSRGKYVGHDFRFTEPEVEKYKDFSTESYSDTCYDMANSYNDSSLSHDIPDTSLASSYDYAGATANADYQYQYRAGNAEDGLNGYASVVATGWD
ncbi:hypothetical protein L6164_011382 [Bauhinia variegata]|uniref:Uncharacterized protein n=1 Tax=Bauhinia variegata TaxID=167791 RepID=A0ACB9P5Q8_BAUVA|nr:hypothetical protein L6164_011382 [Bauhinia variegata]